MKHINLTDVEGVKEKGAKRNFRKACKFFNIKDGHLFYKGSKDKKNRRVLFEKERQEMAIHDIHEGLSETPEAVALSSHRGRESTYQKLSERFFWHGMVADVKRYIKACEKCQKQDKIFSRISAELHSIPITPNVMHQVGVDICNLPEVNGMKHDLIVLIDYFSKWSEAKAAGDKSAITVARFLYKMMCRHGCFQTQINDQGKEFVNEISNELHRLTGTDQRVTSAYHPQSNGLCERQNRTIKDSLIKVLEGNADKWPDIVEGVLFAHRVSVHFSTKFSPFFLCTIVTLPYQSMSNTILRENLLILTMRLHMMLISLMLFLIMLFLIQRQKGHR